MGFFDDDPFDEILNEFFGQRGRPRTSSAGNVVRSEREERVVDYVEEEDFVYFVFELPGYSEEDVEVAIKSGEIEVNAIKEKPEGVQPYLYGKLQKGIYFRKKVPEKVKAKKMSYHFKNGILEVKFPRK